MYAVMEFTWLPSGSGPLLALGWLPLVGLAMAVWGRWMARRAAAGHEVRIWCRLHGFAPPYPRRFVRGRVRLLPQAGVMEFRPYGREALRLACGGTVQQVSKVKWGGSGGMWGHREVDYLPVPEGGAVRIWVSTPHSQTLLAMLTMAPAVPESAPHAPVRAGSPLWRFLGGEPVALLLVGAALLLPVAFVYGLGRPVTAHVATTGHGAADTCLFTWTDPWDGGRHETSRYCGNRQPGDPIDVIALDRPLRGSATGTVLPAALWGFSSAPFLLVGIILALVYGIGDARSWPPRTTPPATLQAAAPPTVD
ncbi:hypothetical protein ACFPH6_20485 [Streptomyces xiangluensis]|uniref:PH domain-containing protein n=1 Tax=Streptomyces xiangluensis TaxID=2665720 RepID=A0ABV8YUP7_9ACTN